MPIAIVQQTSFINSTGNATTYHMNFTNPVAPGSTVVVFFAGAADLGGTSPPPQTVSGGSDTFVDADPTHSLLPSGNSSLGVDIFWCQVSAGGYTSLTGNILSGNTNVWAFEISPGNAALNLVTGYTNTGELDTPWIGNTVTESGAAVYFNVVAAFMGFDPGSIINSVNSPWVLDGPIGIAYPNGSHNDYTFTVAHMLGTGAQAPQYHVNTDPDFAVNMYMASVAFSSSTPPPPPLSCAPLDMSGSPVNGVFVKDLSLFIIPSYALYQNLVPFPDISLNENSAQGRKQITLDFNDSEGLYVRDVGTIFTWDLESNTAIDVWQPSIIPMDGEIYDRLSYHFLMTSLGMKGWGHVREINIPFISTTDLTVLLSFDNGASPGTISVNVPNSAGVQAKMKITLPPNKFKMIEGFVSSSAPFKFWTNDMELKVKEWGSTEPYRVVRPVSG